jgi:effector-binding domain-containing protein
MEKETFEALLLLMEKLERHVIHATYQEDSKEAYKKVMEWIEEAGEDYKNNND